MTEQKIKYQCGCEYTPVAKGTYFEGNTISYCNEHNPFKSDKDGGNGYGLPEYTLPSGYKMGAGGQGMPGLHVQGCSGCEHGYRKHSHSIDKPAIEKYMARPQKDAGKTIDDYTQSNLINKIIEEVEELEDVGYSIDKGNGWKEWVFSVRKDDVIQLLKSKLGE